MLQVDVDTVPAVYARERTGHTSPLTSFDVCVYNSFVFVETYI